MDDYLMYPNLMSKEQIITILKDRYLQIPDLENLSMSELIKIYSKFALPLSQRESKNSLKINSLSQDDNSDSSKQKCLNLKNTNYLKRTLQIEVDPHKSSTESSYCKKIKLGNGAKTIKSNFEKICSLKNDINSDIVDQCEQKFKRQKISWP